MKELAHKSILEIVEDNYLTASVFEKHGIPFYRQEEGQTLQDFCSTNKIDYLQLANELTDIMDSRYAPQGLPINTWKLEFLTDYIKHVHHDYVAMVLPQINASVEFLMGHCTEKKEFMRQLSEELSALTILLTSSNLHEEEIIFPYIRQLEILAEKNDEFGSLFVRTLRKPMDTIEKGHEAMTRLLARIHELTENYSISNLTCPKLRVVMRQLKDLETYMMEHKFLEKNILFPRAVELESRLLKQHTG
jgi:regulator of cell morphogenesis and NO signaling